METAPTPGKVVSLGHSPAVDSVWRMAAREAAISLYRYIEREHLLIALFALEKAAGACTGSDAQSLRSESEDLRCLYEVVHKEPEAAAELLRKRIGTQGYKHTLKIVHRSGACRSMFNYAESLARGCGETTVRCIHLLAAVLEDPGEHFLSMLEDPSTDLGVVRRNVARSLHKHDRALPVQREGPEVGEPFKKESMESAVATSPTPSGETNHMLVPPHWHRVHSHDLIVDMEAGPVINLGVFQCSGAIVSKLLVTNRGSTWSVSQALRISLSEYAVSEEVTLPSLAPAQTIELDIPKFRFDYAALESRVEKSLCFLSVRLGESVLHGPPVEIWLLPANEWACGRTREHQLSLASFVMPNHPSVEELVGAACVHLPAEHNAGESLRAMYEHLLKNWELSYTFEPPAWGAVGQKIRFPHQVLLNSIERRGHGTCIDLALLVAAGLEYLHHEPLIAVLDIGDTWHSLVGCWRYRRDGLEPLLYEKERILTEAFWVDPNGCTRSPGYGWEFSHACREADALLARNPLVFALDVASARRIGRVEPLPFSGQPELSKEVRAAIAKAHEIGQSLHQPVGTVHIFLGLLTIDNGVTREILREIGMPADQAIDRLTAGLSNLRGGDEEGLALTRHHDMVLSVARSLAKRAGLHIVLEQFALEALFLTPSSALDNALRNLGTGREALHYLFSKTGAELKTYPTVPSMFPA